MASDLYRAFLTNNAQGASNPAIMDFSIVSGGVTAAQAAAGIVGYCAVMDGQAIFGPNVSIIGISQRLSGAAGSTPVPFPVAAYAAIEAANTFLPTYTAYGLLGATSGSYAPLGTSITLSLYSNTPGRKTTGRHYVPWVSVATNDGSGRVSGAAVAVVEDAYDAMIMGNSNGLATGVLDLVPAVQSATVGTNLIVTPKASTVFARLKTRTR